MRTWIRMMGVLGVAACCCVSQALAQSSSTMRPIQSPGSGSAASPSYVPRATLPLPSSNPYVPSSAAGFDPYSTRPSYQNPSAVLPSTGSPYGSPVYPQSTMPSATGTSVYPQPGASVYPGTSGSVMGGTSPTYPTAGMTAPGYPNPGYSTPGLTAPGYTMPGGMPSTYGAPTYPSAGPYGGTLPNSMPQYPTTLNPIYPGMGQSGTIGVYNAGPSGVYPPGMIPGTTPPSLFPTSVFGASPNPYGYGASGSMIAPGAYGTWNPQGTIMGVPGTQQFARFFQGPRFRSAWIYGNNDPDALMIIDNDVALAFAIPNFLFSTQPLYLMPSFSLHNWDGPKATAADMPPIAYSAFLDTGWQSDPLRIAGAEVGVRVGVFTDFETYNTDSLRVMGRGLGRLRLTPTATLKGGIVYLDRNKVEFLPAGGILWQPNPVTRFDLFFPEPKLAHYLSTVGNFDTWWYLNGYYGGGTWTIKRANGSSDSVDINDIRVSLGVEWGKNDQLRDGRRVGFFEIGYVFNRELYYKHSPGDNMDLQDSLIIRAGVGY